MSSIEALLNLKPRSVGNVRVTQPYFEREGPVILDSVRRRVESGAR